MEESNEAQTSGTKPWIKPAIVPLRSGLLNKFGNKQEAAWMDTIDNVPIADLVEQHGAPLFVLSEQRLRHNIQRIKRVFCARYPRVVFGWSYKTNYLGAVCNIFHQEGSWAEVVGDP